MKLQYGKQNEKPTLPINDNNSDINFDFEENSPFQEGIMS